MVRLLTDIARTFGVSHSTISRLHEASSLLSLPTRSPGVTAGACLPKRPRSPIIRYLTQCAAAVRFHLHDLSLALP